MLHKITGFGSLQPHVYRVDETLIIPEVLA